MKILEEELLDKIQEIEYYISQLERHLNRRLISRPVGNHDLERNYVFHLYDNWGFNAIFKIFNKKNRWNREVAALKTFRGSSIQTPRMLDFGIFDDGVEWTLIEFFEGIAFENISNQLSSEEIESIYYDMGIELAKIHESRQFDFFGNWDRNGNGIDCYRSFRDYFSTLFRSIEFCINGTSHTEQELIDSSINYIWHNMAIIDSVIEPKLCHNDFSSRNVIINRESTTGKYFLSSIIDFEQCLPSDPDKDLLYALYHAKMKSPESAAALLSGYKSLRQPSEFLFAKEAFYEIYNGLYIISWSKNSAPAHYEEGMELLRKNTTKS